jgi:hypothetical protein
MKAARLSSITIEWLDTVSRPGEARDETIARLLRERDRVRAVPAVDGLLARRDATLRLDEL